VVAKNATHCPFFRTPVVVPLEYNPNRKGRTSMYVLMDIEWITNSDNHINPTQIAALRVDEHWNETGRFFERIRPRDSSFHQWNHMGYSGGDKASFLNADSLSRVFSYLDLWLTKDDVLCWWTPDSIKVFNSMYLMSLRRSNTRKHILLRDYVYPFLQAQKIVTGSPYKIAKEYGIPKFSPKHQSLSDVLTMRSVLASTKYPSYKLALPPEVTSAQKETTDQTSTEEWLYQYDEKTGYVHRKGCTAIPPNTELKGYMKLLTCLKKKFIPCPVCAKEEYRQIRHDWNQDVIDRSQYQFIYTDNSKVFHRRDCKMILNTTGVIKGSVYYDGCVRTGRRPCKICNPEPGTWLNTNAWRKSKKKAKEKAKEIVPDAIVPARSMTSGEQRAYKRYVEARGERLAAQNVDFKTEKEKNDFYTLTQPRYAFFSAAGYQSFHQRSCKKLQGLTDITGYARYKDAIRAGHTPCKHCKPTAKLDIECAIPITNQKRKDETINDLQTLCADYNYPCKLQQQFFCFVTPVGRWKIDVSAHPYIVYHINRVVAPHNEHDYHRQPRLFLSLADTFEYIQRHDRQLMDRTSSFNEPDGIAVAFG